MVLVELVGKMAIINFQIMYLEHQGLLVAMVILGQKVAVVAVVPSDLQLRGHPLVGLVGRIQQVIQHLVVALVAVVVVVQAVLRVPLVLILLGVVGLEQLELLGIMVVIKLAD
jgi:hypothetical protein